MTGFSSPIDICNRGLDAIGARNITNFSDASRNSDKCNEVYDKLRQAELRRNTWVFSTRRAALRPIDTTTMVLFPLPYNGDTFYHTGDIASYNDEYYIVLQDMPLGAIPPTDANGQVAETWDNYFGPLTVDVWVNPNSTTNTPGGISYHAGEIVYLAPGNGTFSAFLSLVDDNSDDPLEAVAWATGTSYVKGQLVLGTNNTIYQSQFSLNNSTNPVIDAAATSWLIGTTYGAGAYVYYTDGQIYQSLSAGNVGHLPTNTTYWLGLGMWSGAWSATIDPQPVASSSKWHFLSCNLQPLTIVFPLGCGPLSQTTTRNLFMLPNNFLMTAAAEDQLGNKVSPYGAMQPMAQDYVFEGRFFISQAPFTVVMRFISDFQNVTLMEAMFCEGLAARIGFELCETLTQDGAKKASCERTYDRVMGEARTVNAIEVGPVLETQDEFITVRY